ncbi:unnamed protein product, partial [marine sediment metagenome]
TWYWRKKPYYAKAIYNPVQHPDDLDKIPEPDWEGLRKRVKQLRDPIRKLKDRGYWVTMEGKGAFEAAWMLFRGPKNARLASILLNPSTNGRISVGFPSSTCMVRS